MATWNLIDTYALVRQAFGPEQEKLARESARSVTDRQAFASYHFSETMRLAKAFEKKHLHDISSILELHAAGAEVKERAFQGFMIKVGAHSLAAVQSLHAIPDIFAHAVYFSAGQNLRPYALDDSKVAVQSVVSCLKKDVRFKSLADQLKSIQSGVGWQHLAALSNISKHRSVVRSAYNEDWTGERQTLREIHISAFERNGKNYPSKELRGLLEPEYRRIMGTVIAVGNALNECLR